MIEVFHLSKTVPTAQGTILILDDLNFQIQSATSVAIVGPSGSGKSTLLGLLAGLDLPSQGYVSLDGVNLNNLSEEQRSALRLGRVGFVFQSFELVPSLTALENISLPLVLMGLKNPLRLAAEQLEKVGLAHRGEHYPSQLSGGEQQRVALARAFSIKPKLLFVDEPTGNLDQQTGAKIIELLFELQAQEQSTLVLVTHDLNLAARCQQLVQL